jgi:RecA/RadA recombinase
VRKIHLAFLLLPLLAACGGDSSTGPDQSRQEITGTVGAFGTTEHGVFVSRAGNMTVKLTWADASIDLDLYLTYPDCTGYPPLDCTILAASNAVGTKEESVQRTVSSGEHYLVWVDNFSESQPSNYTIEITIN